jgi:hypothetical protein
MGTGALFTPSDLSTIERASVLAEAMTGEYFNLAPDEWKRNPYGIFTRKEVERPLEEESVFAQIVRLRPDKARSTRRDRGEAFGIILQDPNILQALLRSTLHDLWTLALFILTHELIHIVRFRSYSVDFHASEAEREREERLVYAITRDILAGVANTNDVLRLYQSRVDGIQPDSGPIQGVN